MKTLQLTVTLLTLLIANLSILACSDDDPVPGCFQDQNLDIIAAIKNAGGTIRGPVSGYCEGDFVVEPDDKVESRPLGLFYPCKLDDEFEVDGARVIFSGYVYESPDNVDLCADYFEITEMSLMN